MLRAVLCVVGGRNIGVCGFCDMTQITIKWTFHCVYTRVPPVGLQYYMCGYRSGAEEFMLTLFNIQDVKTFCMESIGAPRGASLYTLYSSSKCPRPGWKTQFAAGPINSQNTIFVPAVAYYNCRIAPDTGCTRSPDQIFRSIIALVRISLQEVL